MKLQQAKAVDRVHARLCAQELVLCSCRAERKMPFLPSRMRDRLGRVQNTVDTVRGWVWDEEGYHAS